MITARVKVNFNHLPKISKAVRIRTKWASNVFAEGVLRDMQSLVPKRTWALHNSLAVKPSAGIAAGGIFHVVIVAGMPYWIFVEHGTSRMEARPFIMPALLMNQPEFERLMRRAVSEAVVSLGAVGYSGMVDMD
jgi:HK97 gp10 family phage protein